MLPLARLLWTRLFIITVQYFDRCLIVAAVPVSLAVAGFSLVSLVIGTGVKVWFGWQFLSKS